MDLQNQRGRDFGDVPASGPLPEPTLAKTDDSTDKFAKIITFFQP
jgi:hypothetical protein